MRRRGPIVRLKQLAGRSTVLALTLLLFPSSLAAQANGQLQIHFINVGQGDAALIISPLGETMLIDSGPQSAVNCAGPTGIITYLSNMGLVKLDYHLASHYDADHIGCTGHIAARWPIQKAAYDRGGANVPSTIQYAEYAAAVASRRQAVTAGQTIVLDATSTTPVRFEVLAVNGNGQGTSEESDRSVVMVMHFGGFDAEFGGDLPNRIESTLTSAIGHVELYKVHQHGSDTSSGFPFIDAIRPRVAVLSVGSPNAFNHPAQSAVNTIHQFGTTMYWTTPGDGAPAQPVQDIVANGSVVVSVFPGASTFAVNAAGSSTPYALLPPPNCGYGLFGSSFVAGPRATTVMATVTTQSGCAWTAVSASPWLTVTAGASTFGTGAVTMVLTPNLTPFPRLAHAVIAGILYTAVQRGRTSAPGDFNGDGQADFTVFRPSNGTWYFNYGSSVAGYQWGNGADVPVAADYDGDGRSDIAVFRPANGIWFVVDSSTGLARGLQWGNGADVPVPADYDGDGRTDIAVFRPSDRVWYIVPSSTGLAIGIQWGEPGDKPVPGDYDADGKTDVAVFRPSTGTWLVQPTGGGGTVLMQWGNANDIAVPGDYDGDGRTDFAVFRPSDGVWYISYRDTVPAAGFQWGNGADIPVPGDYNGDALTDLAVFRPGDGTWYIRFSGGVGAKGVQWGNGADIPMPRRP